MDGIAVAGSILVDCLNEISAYPAAGELAKIIKVERAVGGCVPNVAIDLKTLEPKLTVKAVGMVGTDDNGKYVIECLSKKNVDISGIKISENLTDFTEVMSVTGGERTFFNYSGAGSEFGFGDVDFAELNVKMLHLGYFLLLDAIDKGDGLNILRAAKRRGIKTSIDLVSENSDRYVSVLPCLKYVDNLIINEVEAGRLAGMDPELSNIKEIARKLKSYGVSERVIIHMPEVGICLSDSGFTAVPSLELPQGFIKGTTGAGDAFCAGALLGIYNGCSDDEILSMGSVVAASALSSADATSGLREYGKLKQIFKNFGRIRICL